MIRIFEGPRNSGKTFLAREYSSYNNLKIFKFDFVGWFNRLELPDTEVTTHNFALGKELMLLQLNRDRLLPDFVLDRGILTVLTWGILSGRISEQDAINQIKMIAAEGLFDNCEIVYVYGENPDKDDRNKDNWDFRDGENDEAEIMQNIRDIISGHPYNVKVKLVHNTFDSLTVQKIKDLK
jgi:hypothetical protein